MSEAERVIYDVVIAKAVANAYDSGYLAGRDIGYNAGFLAAIKTEVSAGDCESLPEAA
ncbi:hypothetical protein [Paenibacillus sp. FSL R7-269]|uniref:hypothetical protein n=1 Tax=Paenibacillus sp. FSL R7-269 TaxID=1226755 RepID=UPI0012EC3480|nr:hypothetical protein [Paenibacillus sp. FSL R7-269]